MSKPCIVIATFRPLPGRHDDVVSAITSITPEVHQEDGCELYALHDEVDGTLVLIEKWTSRELWMTHQTLEPVGRLRAAIDGALDGDVDVREMYGLESGNPHKGLL
jgi:quinol monooxygenase YgiN